MKWTPDPETWYSAEIHYQHERASYLIAKLSNGLRVFVDNRVFHRPPDDHFACISKPGTKICVRVMEEEGRRDLKATEAALIEKPVLVPPTTAEIIYLDDRGFGRCRRACGCESFLIFDIGVPAVVGDTVNIVMQEYNGRWRARATGTKYASE